LSVVCCVEAAFFFAFDSVGTGLEAVNVPGGEGMTTTGFMASLVEQRMAVTITVPDADADADAGGSKKVLSQTVVVMMTSPEAELALAEVDKALERV